MVNPVPTSLEKAWEDCNVQVFVLLSLFLQTFLIIVAPFRKRSGSLWVSAFVWSAYLLADWAASFAAGLISSNSLLGGSNKKNPNPNPNPNGDLLVFWASFLLLHLGGPDTITALSLEDNALWLRQFLGLVFQVIAAGYILLLSLPANTLLVPTLLVLFAGVIKYTERTRSLYLASTDIVFEEHALKGDPSHSRCPEDEDEEEVERRLALTPIVFLEERILDHDPALVIYARNYFEIFRGIKRQLVNLDSEDQFKDTTHRLVMRDSERAMEMISIELNWLYQLLYTKGVAVRSKYGYILRFTSFFAILAALLVFIMNKRSEFNGVSVVITYVLLGGAIFLDTISFFMLIFSDWTFSEMYINHYKLGQSRWVIGVFHRIYLKLRRPNLSSNTISSFPDRARKILFRRWSESISCYNLIEYCVRENPKWRRRNNMLNHIENIYLRAIEFFGVKDLRDRVKYVARKPLSKELWDFVLKEVHSCFMNSEYFSGSGKISTFGRGVYTLQGRGLGRGLVTLVEQLQYEESLLVWHIASEICYYITDEGDSLDTDRERHRSFCKLLSGYMLYLLVVQPEVVSSTPDKQLERFKSTCVSVNWVFTNSYLGSESELKQACRIILEKFPEANEAANKNTLERGSALATMLEELRGEKWEVISGVWVELLAYGAYNSRPMSHARLLTGGSELISYVWLAMAHLGICRKRSEE